MGKRKTSNKHAPWSDGKLLTWAIIWIILFFPVGLGMLAHYFIRKSNRALPPVVPWSSWPESVHESAASTERMERAISQGFKYRPCSEPGVYTVKGTEGDTYYVSFGGCTCPDYARRGRPCKHMYGLAIQRGGFDPKEYLWENGL